MKDEVEKWKELSGQVVMKKKMLLVVDLPRIGA